jgi:DNA primase
MTDPAPETMSPKTENPEPKMTPKPESVTKEEKPDPISLLVNKLTAMEQKLEQATAPPVKKKRVMSQKQLDNLANARAKRNANMAKRQQIKAEVKINEKKLVNEKLKELNGETEKNVIIKQEQDAVPQVSDPPAPAVEPPKPIDETTHPGNPNIPASAPIDIPQRKQPVFNFAARPYRRR